MSLSTTSGHAPTTWSLKLRVLTHLLLGVQSTAAADARTVAEAAC